MMIENKLRETQHDSTHHEGFEKTLKEAFEILGFHVKHIGGTDKPDLALEIKGHRIIADAKTTKRGGISETYVNFDALERYKRKYKAERVAVVAPSFLGKNIKNTAKKRNIILIETEAICRALQNHAIYRYHLPHLYQNLFGSEKIYIKPQHIESSMKENENLVNIVRGILSLKSKSFTIENLQFHFLQTDKEYERSEVENALGFLSTPPLNVVKEEDKEYSFTLDIGEIKNKFGIIFGALGFTTEATPFKKEQVPEVSRGKGKHVTAGEFEHIGDGVYLWKSDKKVKIDAKKPSRDVENALRTHGLWNRCMSSFYHSLRTKARLIRK